MSPGRRYSEKTRARCAEKRFDHLRKHYAQFFRATAEQQGLKRPYVADPDDIRQLTAYLSWAAWVSTATRPGTSYSYTNNWPSEPMVGNDADRRSVPVERAESDHAAGRNGLGALRRRAVGPVGLASGR